MEGIPASLTGSLSSCGGRLEQASDVPDCRC